jgi:hypothetical protein
VQDVEVAELGEEETTRRDTQDADKPEVKTLN